MQKEATVLILDVGKTMEHDNNEEGDSFQSALKAITLLVRDVLVEKPNTALVSLVLVGTKASNNRLHSEEGGGYEHVSVVYELANPSLELMRFVTETSAHDLLHNIGGASGDFVDALIVALDMLTVKAEGKAYTKKVFLVTDGGSKSNFQCLDSVVEKFNALDCSLNIV